MIYEIYENESINVTLANMKDNDILILNDGIYNEKVFITNNNITIKAKNLNKAIIQNKDYYHKIMENNNECNTFGTYTMFVGGDNVTLDGLHIKNLSTPSKIYGQAVALHANSNNFLCKNTIIESAQDTLFTGPLPDDLIERYNNFHKAEILKKKPTHQVYNNCTIIGDVDYIFGGATALFINCKLITIDNNSKNPVFIAAPSHDKNLPYGFLFYKCKTTNHKPAYLARPWRDYGCVAFIDNEIDSNIVPDGFDKWNNSNRDKTARFFEYSKHINTERVKWSVQLDEQESKEYVYNFLNYINYDKWAK